MSRPRHPKANHFQKLGLVAGVQSFGELEARIAALPTEQARGAALEIFAEACLATQRVYQARDVWPGNSMPSALRLGLKHRPTFKENYLRPALHQGLIERTIPDKPNSRLQKYRLTSMAAPWIFPCSHDLAPQEVACFPSPQTEASLSVIEMSDPSDHERQEHCLGKLANLNAARRALEQQPPALLDRVLQQAAASRKFITEWRAKGLPDLPVNHLPPSSR